MTLPGSAESPPAASIRSRIGVPIGTIRFFGSAIAEPSTVTHLSTSGMPSSMNCAILAREVMLMIITPNDASRCPSATTLPVALNSSTCFAPCGYTLLSGLTSTAGSSANTRFISAIASGLLVSMPIINCSAFMYFFSSATPLTIRSLCSTIVRLSLVMYGSHSAPLIRTVWIGERRTASSFAHKGNAAPPSPTIPLLRTAARNSSRSWTSGAARFGSFSIFPSLAMRMESTVFPPSCTKGSIAVTVPDTVA